MLSQHTIAVVKSTIPLLTSAGPALTDHFYKRMFRDNPELKDVFNLSNQENGRQPAALFDAVAAYATHIDNLAVLGSAVERIAQKHTGFLIQPEQYQIVGHHLLETLKELGGDAVTPEIIQAWGEAYGFLAQIFIDREQTLYQQAASQVGGWQGTRAFTISAKIPESDVITSFELTPVDGLAVPTFAAGQYLSVKLTHPSLANSEIRQYSLSDASNSTHFRISVKREPEGKVSNLLHDAFQMGDVIDVIPPAGDFMLKAAPTQPLVLISAGVGLTPMMAMLNQRLANSAQTTLWLHACDHSQVHAFSDDIKAKQAQHPELTSYVWYRQPLPNDTLGEHFDFSGLMHLEVIAQQLPLNGEYYFCGPVPFMQMVAQQLKSLGIAESQLHYEVFGPHQSL
ncbi:NO-inducible flavohemoprotein [Shewanella sp. NIFS-20-20]|uniref:NO-inducible flavohemoprotein n=1 Tax=Shewanella sp. NIFS-20-20 TaxID=2853806 RepID=UPI001C44C144|nr:NO-inducible flavohemoprotein [Shewanella sp. NIFS-20-20]MBV7314467.1 NO-inducible flavohemoprotein [Shewanella sp. NIFS-20-20]